MKLRLVGMYRYTLYRERRYVICYMLGAIILCKFRVGLYIGLLLRKGALVLNLTKIFILPVISETFIEKSKNQF